MFRGDVTGPQPIKIESEYSNEQERAETDTHAHTQPQHIQMQHRASRSLIGLLRNVAHDGPPTHADGEAQRGDDAQQRPSERFPGSSSHLQQHEQPQNLLPAESEYECECVGECELERDEEFPGRALSAPACAPAAAAEWQKALMWRESVSARAKSAPQ